MNINNNYTLINIDENENGFYMNRFNNKTNYNSNDNNNFDNVLTSVFFTTDIKNSVINLIKDFNSIYYTIQNYYKISGKELYNHLLNYYNLDLNLSYHNFKIICNVLNYRYKIIVSDLSQNDIDLLRLYDLKYFDKKHKVILTYKEVKNITIIILKIIGYDKTYYIQLSNYNKDILNTNRIININKKRSFQKLQKFYKNNRYNYKKCKNKILRKTELELTKGQKYTHNFQTNDFQNYKNHNNYLDLIINDLLFYYDNNQNHNDTVEKNYYDLIELYYNKYNLNDLKEDLQLLKDNIYNQTENDYKNGFNIDFLTNSKKIKCIKIFLDIISIYEYRINKENIQTDLKDYDNFNYNLKNYFVYHKTKDKI